LSKTDVINTYLSVIDIINFQKNDVKEKKALHNIAIATNTIDEIFSKSNAADCEGIVAVFENKFINDSNNIDLILKIQSLLKGANCINSDLYFNTAYKLNILRPNAENAYILAGISIKREKHEDAVTFLKNAIELEKVDSIKSKYCLDLSIHYYTNLKQYQIARNYAYQAIELNKNWGKPYITIGDIYTSANNCGTNDFEKSAVLWAAVDKYNKAKEIEPDLTEFANKKIEYYKRFFPINSDAFFYGYTDGNPYKINCWINETTIVRTRK
ncbi:MAG: hypothetical protein JXA16_00735, partial [Bacteroidales bacterium]|nr:hypothetical protein [Bacteroidales bacterium]